MIILVCLWAAIQIIAEMLPISSSTHALLFERWFYATYGISLTSYIEPLPLKAFYYFLHGPTLLLMLLYWYRRYALQIKQWLTVKNVFSLAVFVGIADSLCVAGYLLLHLYPVQLPVWVGLSVTIAVLFSLYKAPASSARSLTIADAFIIGIAQTIALLPGISRLAITYAVARWRGLPSLVAFDIAWIVQMPLMAAAWCFSILTIHMQRGWSLFYNPWLCLTLIGATSIAWYALSGVVYLVQRDRMALFAWYIIIPLVLSLIL